MKGNNQKQTNKVKPKKSKAKIKIKTWLTVIISGVCSELQLR